MNKFLLAGVAAAALCAISAPASAATIVPLTGTSVFTAPFQAGAPIFVDLGSLTPIPFTGVTGPSGGGTFDFTFSVTTPLKTFTQLQVNGSDVFGYSLFSGLPGAGSLITASTTPNAFTSILGAGNYFLEVTLPTHTAVGSVNNISGLVSTSAVPEPATWAMMIAGLFGVGAMLRRSRRLTAATAAA